MVSDGAITLLRVRGIPIRAHWTLVLVLPYLALTTSSPGTGLLLAIALFASIAFHELAHAWVALRYGGRVVSITLMVIGGVSQLSLVPRRPLHEAAMALAGPATSVAIGAACLAASELADGAPAVQAALFDVAVMNLSLGVFNLLPAFPMDGGRILRALLSSRLGHGRATAIASTVGKACAIGLGIVAAVQPNLMLGLIALFVYHGAAREAASEMVDDALATFAVTDLLPRHQPVPVVESTVSLGDAARRMAELDRLELVVEDGRGPVAVLAADDVARLAEHHASWPLGALVSQLRTRFVIVSCTDRARDALASSASHGASYVGVVRPPSAVIGLIGPQDIARTASLHSFVAPGAHDLLDGTP